MSFQVPCVYRFHHPGGGSIEASPHVTRACRVDPGKPGIKSRDAVECPGLPLRNIRARVANSQVSRFL